jgi:hypothetical protein
MQMTDDAENKLRELCLNILAQFIVFGTMIEGPLFQ